jgi:hypothetical protein
MPTDTLAAYKVYFHLRSMRQTYFTTTDPTPFEIYYMASNLEHMEPQYHREFRSQCERSGVRVPSRKRLQALQREMFPKFTMPVAEYTGK